MTPPAPVQFGQVWESPDEAIGSMRYLVVSSNAYNDAFGDRRVIAVEIDSRAIFEGVYREPITDAGTAYLDRLTWVARSHLVQLIGHLHPARCTPSSPGSGKDRGRPCLGCHQPGRQADQERDAGVTVVTAVPAQSTTLGRIGAR